MSRGTVGGRHDLEMSGEPIAGPHQPVNPDVMRRVNSGQALFARHAEVCDHAEAAIVPRHPGLRIER